MLSLKNQIIKYHLYKRPNNDQPHFPKASTLKNFFGSNFLRLNPMSLNNREFSFWFIIFRHSLLTSCCDRCFQSYFSLLTFLSNTVTELEPLWCSAQIRLAPWLQSPGGVFCSSAPSTLLSRFTFFHPFLHLLEL